MKKPNCFFSLPVDTGATKRSRGLGAGFGDLNFFLLTLNSLIKPIGKLKQ